VRQHHGIKVGDLVKFKHQMFEKHGAVHLVTKAWVSKDGDGHGGPSGHIVLHGGVAQHRTANFVVISRGRK
tara:strand:- start:2223 stop:2435 length:213 start_codon:yes stop_codon:yes gene_type:complete